MSKKYESWVIQLLDDFWVSFYPGVPRQGNATESKCRTIEKEIGKNISSSSLYNYFNEKSSPPTDGTKGIMSYYILQQWKEQMPQKFASIEINDADLARKDAPDKYLIMYRRLKANQNTLRYPNDLPTEIDNNTYQDIKVMESPRVKWLFVGCLTVVTALIIYFNNVAFVDTSPIAIKEVEDVIGKLKNSFNSILLISVLHVFTIGLLLVIYKMPFGTQNQIKTISDSYTKASLLQFEKGWMALWMSWVVLYSWMAFKTKYNLNLLIADDLATYLQTQPTLWAISDVVNVFSTFCFFYLFLALDVQTITATDEDNQTVKNQYYQMVSVVMIVATLFLILTITDRYLDLGTWDNIGTWLYVLFTSLAMLYFFGRLDSHYFKAHRILLAPLYFYAVIQVNWDDLPFVKFASQGLVIFFIAFLLKIYLFFIINGWIRNGDFGRYFQQMRLLHRKNDGMKNGV